VLDEVCRLANRLKAAGVRKGDHVAVYMPMLVELPIAMLACARIGAVHSVVFGGFSAEALAGGRWLLGLVQGPGATAASALRNVPSCPPLTTLRCAVQRAPVAMRAHTLTSARRPTARPA
jgi:hypothetical protein